jgi:hypothetical protein
MVEEIPSMILKKVFRNVHCSFFWTLRMRWNICCNVSGAYFVLNISRASIDVSSFVTKYPSILPLTIEQLVSKFQKLLFKTYLILKARTMCWTTFMQSVWEKQLGQSAQMCFDRWYRNIPTSHAGCCIVVRIFPFCVCVCEMLYYTSISASTSKNNILICVWIFQLRTYLCNSTLQ